ncbi:MAG: AI-2E family transporter [Syntrophales bacterium]|nr:AI-2E family transporter [Syntrophales bacterium]MDD5642988.1 AI-2E family transporter [Syntrophales bacterium]
MTEPEHPKEGRPQPPQAASAQAEPPPAAEPCPPCPPGEEQTGFPTQFARLFFGVITLLVLYFSYLIIKPYLLDIFMALVLFFTARPLHHALTRILFGRRTLASLVTCLILALVILIPLVSLVSIIANQALEFSGVVRQGLQDGQLWQWVDAKVNAVHAWLLHLKLPVPSEQIKLDQIILTVLTKASEFIYSNAIGLLKGFTYFFLDLVLVLFIAFFMFIQGDDFIEEIKKLSPLDAVHNEEILHETETTIKATLWGTVIVAFAQGILGGVGFWIFGLPQPAFWGTVMIPAAVIPVVGSAIIWGPAAIYLLVAGHLGPGLGLIVWGGVLVSVIDNLLKPLLMKGSGSTPSVFILFSILGGIAYFGIIGFILGPLILSFLLSLLRIYQKTILSRPAPAAPAAVSPEK